MSNMRIQSDPARVAVEASRDRQTSVPTSPFRNVLTSSASVLLSGAAVATSVIGGPVLAAAVHQAAAGVAPGPTTRSTAAAAPGGGPGDHGDMAAMHAMQRESQAFNLQLLALQEDVQQENRHFTTVSNVLRAKHDTAKAALSNIRS